MLDPALASSKTYKSEFYISGLPKYAHQGCHIFGGCKDIISNLAPDNGEFINKGSHSIRIFRDFYLIISLSDRGVKRSSCISFEIKYRCRQGILISPLIRILSEDNLNRY